MEGKGRKVAILKAWAYVHRAYVLAGFASICIIAGAVAGWPVWTGTTLTVCDLFIIALALQGTIERLEMEAHFLHRRLDARDQALERLQQYVEEDGPFEDLDVAMEAWVAKAPFKEDR